MITASLVITALGYAPVALTHLPTRMSWDVSASVAGLALVCTALAFVIFFELIREVGPARSTVVTYINPAVAVLLGVTVLDEPFTIGMAVGLPLVLVGMVLATGPSPRRPAEPLTGGPPLQSPGCAREG